MSSKFFGTFEVTSDFVNEYVTFSRDAELGEWLLVGSCRVGAGFRFSIPLVEVYGADDTYRDALDYLRSCIRNDYTYREEYDYEIWHVVANPDWMPAQPYTLNCIELLDHADRGAFDETLVWCDLEEIPGNGVAVLRTDWGFYVPTDCQTSTFPRTLDELTDWKEYDFVEVDTDNDYFAWVPTAEIDAFCNACEGLVRRCDGLEWCDVQRLRISGDALRRMASA